MMKLNPKWVKGEVWDEGGKSGILQIMISHEERKINSFQFTYVDQKGDVGHSEIHGELSGWNFNIVTFDYPSEFVTSLSGVYNFQELIVIAFGSNKRMYGPFGMTKTGNLQSYALLLIVNSTMNLDQGLHLQDFMEGFTSTPLHHLINSNLSIRMSTNLNPTRNRLNSIQLTHFHPNSTSNNMNKLVFVASENA